MLTQLLTMTTTLKFPLQECDQGLSGLVLGYASGELVGRRIEEVLPGFYDEFDLPSSDRFVLVLYPERFKI